VPTYANYYGAYGGNDLRSGFRARKTSGGKCLGECVQGKMSYTPKWYQAVQIHKQTFRNSIVFERCINSTFITWGFCSILR